MQGDLAAEYGVWLQLALVLAVGTAVVVGLAALAGRWVRSAVWRRTIWQVATLGLLALLAVELTGMGPALVRLCHLKTQPAPIEAAASPIAETAANPVSDEERASSRSVGFFVPEGREAGQHRGLSPAVGEFSQADGTAERVSYSALAYEFDFDIDDTDSPYDAAHAAATSPEYHAATLP